MTARAALGVALIALALSGCTPLILAVAHATSAPEHADEDVPDATPADTAPTEPAR